MTTTTTTALTREQARIMATVTARDIVNGSRPQDDGSLRVDASSGQRAERRRVRCFLKMEAAGMIVNRRHASDRIRTSRGRMQRTWVLNGIVPAELVPAVLAAAAAA